MKLSSRTIDWIVWAAIAAVVVVLVRRRSSGPTEGSPAPRINLPLVGAEGRFDLAQAKGKPVVLEVFASWCGACRRSAPVLAEAYRDHPANDVEFLGVSIDESPAEAARAKERWGIPYAVALDDGSVSRGYKVSLLPTVVIIGRDGVVRHTTTGVPSKRELERWLAER
ncbi:MAG TPA: TlpA disulfide reductase family protein [Polyangiaceae bacterium]|nr:TlpA disulfide reductase family protein [Polyangiaceae bacterium]